MKAYVFPGQGAQFPGMAKDLYDNFSEAKGMLEEANELLGFRITNIMFNGTPEELKETKITQPAIFLHSVVLAKMLGADFQPDMVAGHSLGEFSALVAVGGLDFIDGLDLVSKRALAMQKACEAQPSTMAAVLGLDDEVVETICKGIDGIVVPANYNCPGQLVISGTFPAVEQACEALKEKGARRALILPVGGAFHSPLMQPAEDELKDAILSKNFVAPSTPIYQNYTAKASMDPEVIRENLISQLTGSVRWTQTIQNMMADGVVKFTEVGPGKALQGMIKKIDRGMEVESASLKVD